MDRTYRCFPGCFQCGREGNLCCFARNRGFLQRLQKNDEKTARKKGAVIGLSDEWRHEWRENTGVLQNREIFSSKLIVKRIREIRAGLSLAVKRLAAGIIQIYFLRIRKEYKLVSNIKQEKIYKAYVSQSKHSLTWAVVYFKPFSFHKVSLKIKKPTSL